MMAWFEKTGDQTKQLTIDIQTTPVVNHEIKRPTNHLTGTLPKTNSSHLSGGHLPPKGNSSEPTIHFQVRFVTPLKINMEPQNGGLENDFPLQLGDF